MFKKKRHFTQKPEKIQILTGFHRKKEHDKAILPSFRVKSRARRSHVQEEDAMDVRKITLLFVPGGSNIGKGYVECPIRRTATGSEVSATCSNALAMHGTSESVSSIS